MRRPSKSRCTWSAEPSRLGEPSVDVQSNEGGVGKRYRVVGLRCGEQRRRGQNFFWGWIEVEAGWVFSVEAKLSLDGQTSQYMLHIVAQYMLLFHQPSYIL